MNERWIWVLLIAYILIWAALRAWRRWELRRLVVVQAGQAYPSNLHVPGVGYYHAAVGRWFPAPWNEFREERGYFWDGEWHATPDVRSPEPTVPTDEEITRVNAAWRTADPSRAANFWENVEEFGFGGALARTEGS